MLYCFSTKQDINIIIIIIILCKIWVPQVVPKMKGRNLDKWKKKKKKTTWMMVEVYTDFNWQNLGIVP